MQTLLERVQAFHEASEANERNWQKAVEALRDETSKAKGATQ